MAFFENDNSLVETVVFVLLATLCIFVFPMAFRLARHNPQTFATKLMPALCTLLAYENVVQATGDSVGEHNPILLLAKTTHAIVIPLFLVVMFEVAYAVHKRRSVKFCGIVFDQGHRINTDPCSWFLRHFVRIVAFGLMILGILVTFNVIGDDENAGGSGMVDVQGASTHFILALVPTMVMTLVALYISVYMWKYGSNASIVVQPSIFNRWIMLFLGTLCLLGGQIPPECCFRALKEAGQVLLLLSMILVGREIEKEVKAADNFASFLAKDNEFEKSINPRLIAAGGGFTAGSEAAAVAAMSEVEAEGPEAGAAATTETETAPGTKTNDVGTEGRVSMGSQSLSSVGSSLSLSLLRRPPVVNEYPVQSSGLTPFPSSGFLKDNSYTSSIITREEDASYTSSDIYTDMTDKSPIDIGSRRSSNNEPFNTSRGGAAMVGPRVSRSGGAGGDMGGGGGDEKKIPMQHYCAFDMSVPLRSTNAEGPRSSGEADFV